MQVVQLKIENFRGIRSANLIFPKHVVLIGDNNAGKSTVLEALDLVLGPDRLNRKPIIDEHDFYAGEYYFSEEDKVSPQVKIEATITDLNEEQERHFKDCLECWNENQKHLHTEPPPESIDSRLISWALRVCFEGKYDPEEDDFVGDTYFSRSVEHNKPQRFTKKDKQKCGFLYLRSLRTGSRAFSLEYGSLLDIILRIKELRPQMWEKILNELRNIDVAADSALGISGIFSSIEESLKKYVPKEWGLKPHLKVSNLTRKHLREVITAFIATGEGQYAAPFYRQGTGTINMLVLAMLAQIAEEKQNVIFAMEEPETAIPPYAQKSIVNEVQKLSAQSFFTSHSPYVIEEFDLKSVVILSRKDGELKQQSVELPKNVKLKRYRREFRIRFCEGLLASRILIAEGTTETSAMSAAARRLSELNADEYSSFEALGICTIDADGQDNIAGMSQLYKKLGKKVFAICDKQTDEKKQEIEIQVDQLFMHEEKGFEDLVVKHATLSSKKTADDLDDKTAKKYLKSKKGAGFIADFFARCKESDIPKWVRDTCKKIKKLCQKMPVAQAEAIIEEQHEMMMNDSLV